MLRNAEIRTAVSMYLGGGHRLVEVTGYSILHLGRRVSTERYASGNWHQCVITLEDPTSPQPPNGAVPLPSLSSRCSVAESQLCCQQHRRARTLGSRADSDRCGRRLKMFVYLDDVGYRSHPTYVAAGTHRYSWMGQQTDDSTRFTHDYVTATFGDKVVDALPPRAPH